MFQSKNKWKRFNRILDLEVTTAEAAVTIPDPVLGATQPKARDRVDPRDPARDLVRDHPNPNPNRNPVPDTDPDQFPNEEGLLHSWNEGESPGSWKNFI